ncbi:MAG: hypothetical protein JO016_08490 [Actinobacteria bacterium]|nr:hypothetical protein [Actinomycetota bacterium]
MVHGAPGVPADCTDGFALALWNRPELVLDPAVGAATSGFARMDPGRAAAAVERLARDLATGDWDSARTHCSPDPRWSRSATVTDDRESA